MVAGRDKKCDGAIRKIRIQGEFATKPKPVEEKNIQKKGGQKKWLRRKFLQSITGVGHRTIMGRRRTNPNCPNM